MKQTGLVILLSGILSVTGISSDTNEKEIIEDDLIYIEESLTDGFQQKAILSQDGYVIYRWKKSPDFPGHRWDYEYNYQTNTIIAKYLVFNKVFEVEYFELIDNRNQNFGGFNDCLVDRVKIMKDEIFGEQNNSFQTTYNYELINGKVPDKVSQAMLDKMQLPGNYKGKQAQEAFNEIQILLRVSNYHSMWQKKYDVKY